MVGVSAREFDQPDWPVRRTEAARRAGSRFLTLREAARRGNQDVAYDRTAGGFEPLVQALQSLVDTTSAAYALTARATEEAAKLAADQMATANAGVRQAVERGERKSA